MERRLQVVWLSILGIVTNVKNGKEILRKYEFVAQFLLSCAIISMLILT